MSSAEVDFQSGFSQNDSMVQFFYLVAIFVGRKLLAISFVIRFEEELLHQWDQWMQLNLLILSLKTQRITQNSLIL